MAYKFIYYIHFVGGDTLTFMSVVDMDFHDFKPTAIAFDDMYINMANVTYIQKKEIKE